MPPKRKATPPRRSAAKGNHLAAEFAGFFGKTGSGKSHAMWLKHEEWQRLDHRQVLCWSPKERHDNYAKRLRCKAYADFKQAVIAARSGANVVYVPTLNRAIEEPKFDIFNRLALRLAQLNPRCVMLVEELHTITKPTGGVPSWHVTTTMGRADGLRVLASSQRPAHVDKDFYGALSYAHCGALLFEEDARTASKLVLCTPQEILSLQGFDSRTRSM
jgi:hypothetical protein